MGNRRFAQVSTSDDEDDDVSPRNHQQTARETSSRKRKQVKIREGDDEESSEEEKQKSKKRRGGKEKEAETASGSEDEEEEAHIEDAKPIGEVVKLSGKGRGRRQHYKAFEYDGTRFDLKNSFLAHHLLNQELEPLTIVNMSPDELKEGLTAEERAKKEPDDWERMQQMTDARCSRCSEFKVGVRDIIQAGNSARYQLECISCGHSWYAAWDAVSMLTIDAPSSNKKVGTAPLATAKFEDVEKKLASPRESDKATKDTEKNN